MRTSKKDTSPAQDYMNRMHRACTIHDINRPDSPYYGREGHLRLARETGPSLLDFDEANQNMILSASYGVIYVRACHLKPILDAKEWIAEILSGKRKAIESLAEWKEELRLKRKEREAS